jgi:hypothetical protein
VLVVVVVIMAMVVVVMRHGIVVVVMAVVVVVVVIMTTMMRKEGRETRWHRHQRYGKFLAQCDNSVTKVWQQCDNSVHLIISFLPFSFLSRFPSSFLTLRESLLLSDFTRISNTMTVTCLHHDITLQHHNRYSRTP